MKKRYIYLIIFILAIISIFPLLVKSNIWGHDTNFHIANIKDISESVSLINPFPKISIKIGYGLGYGTHIFYAPLPHYLGGYLHLTLSKIGLGVDNTLVLLYLLTSFLSGIVMYNLVLEITHNKFHSILSSIIYMVFPYRMGDMIVRSSLNEVFMFLFIPMILLSLNRMINKKSFTLMFVVAYVGLILSHLVMALYTTVFIIFWALLFYKEIFRKDNLIKLFKCVLLVSVCVLPFIVLMYSQKIYGNYLVFLDRYTSNLAWMDYYSISLKDFIFPLKDYSWDVPHFINIVVLISFIISIFYYIKKKNKDKNYLYFIILVPLCMIMCFKIFPWGIIPKFFYMIQFPWRLQTYIVIGISIISPLWIQYINQKKVKNLTIFLAISIVLIEIPFIKSMMNYTYILDNNIDYNYGMGNMLEYLPIKSFDMNNYQIIKYLEEHDNLIHCNNCDKKIIKNNNKDFIFNVNTVKDEKIELPRIYYIGYSLKDENNKNISFYENEYGLIEFNNNGNHQYKLTYKGTLIYRVLSYLRILVLLIIFIYFFINRKKNLAK